MIIPTALVHGSMRRLRTDPFALAASLPSDREPRRLNSAQREHRRRAALAETGDPVLAQVALERIIAGNDLAGINYLARGTLCARSVCRVVLRSSLGQVAGYGTGSLVAPGVLLTNWHVLENATQAGRAFVEFDYELDLRGRPRVVAAFALEPARFFRTVEKLDYAVCAVAPRSRDGTQALTEFGWLGLNATPQKSAVGEYLTIIQHPGGEMKQVCVRENKLLKYDLAAPTIWYATDTVGGSSGSPVFNNAWEVVALHHSGVPATDASGRWLTIDGKVYDSSMDESRVRWIANEGIRISAIVTDLKTAHGNHPLLAPLFRGDKPPVIEGAAAQPDAAPGIGAGVGPGVVQADGETVFTIPLRVGFRLGGPPAVGGALLPPALDGAAPPEGGGGDDAVEKVVVDQSNYAKRPGYREDFLGQKFKVPLPQPADTLKAQVLRYDIGAKKGLTLLPYWTYSVLMHRTRKLAIFAAGNVDDRQRPDSTKRDDDTWYKDTRLPDSAQLLQAWYGGQAKFELDRTKNPFDRGHLVRRLDAQWGPNPADQKRNGDDSFHFTNCTPQHHLFNQGSKRWLGLEEYVIENFASADGRACVLNGPVFDAPASRRGPGGRMIPQLTGKPKKDPTFGGVAIPKLFWKVVACVRANKKLGVAAFLVSQEDFLADVDRLHEGALEKLSDAQARLFQVRVADLAKCVHLDFGALATTDTFESTDGPTELGDLDEIRLR